METTMAVPADGQGYPLERFVFPAQSINSAVLFALMTYGCTPNYPIGINRMQSVTQSLGTRIAGGTFHTLNFVVAIFACILLLSCVPFVLLIFVGINPYVSFPLLGVGFVTMYFLLVEAFVRLPTGSYRVSLYESGLRLVAHGIRYVGPYSGVKTTVLEKQKTGGDDEYVVAIVIEVQGQEHVFYPRLADRNELNSFMDSICLGDTDVQSWPLAHTG